MKTAILTPFTIPVACGSFGFFHLVKWLLHRLREARDRRQEVLTWRTLSEGLDRPLVLPYIMVTGPRWNPHALISHVGPFRVERSLRMRVDTAQRSAAMWTFVIYRASDSHTVASLDSNSVARDDIWLEESLPPGTYTGVLRYYGWSSRPILPDLEIDGKRRIPERPVPQNENDYLERLRDKHGIFYVSLHYYVLEMLRLRRYLPESFVQREYLPVGNPETVFRFGYLRRGQCLTITSSCGIPEGHRLYLTIYNRASFPVFWSEVQSLPFRTQAADSTGSYLFRLHALRAPPTPPLWPKHLQVDIQ